MFMEPPICLWYNDRTAAPAPTSSVTTTTTTSVPPAAPVVPKELGVDDGVISGKIPKYRIVFARENPIQIDLDG